MAIKKSDLLELCPKLVELNVDSRMTLKKASDNAVRTDQVIEWKILKNG